MRTLTRWEPRNELVNRNMGRIFDEFIGRRLRPDTDEGSLCGSWTPPVNILEKKEGLEITVELPGMDPKHVDVTVEDGVLSIRGERTFEGKSEDETYHRVESSFGSFERRFTIPTSVDGSKIEARFKNGLMTLSLPKREESKPKSIKVKIETN